MISLSSLLEKKKRVVAGLISGTSMDGIDACICEVNYNGEFKVISFDTIEYPDELKQKIINDSFGSFEVVADLNVEIGKTFSDSLKKLAESKNLIIDLIGTHGQTVFHKHKKTTLQIGEPAFLANEFKCPVISDFRINDIIAGGSGAPLVPYLDYKVFGKLNKNMLIVNIGGISNFTAIEKNSSLEDIFAFDCGPGNMILDELVRVYTNCKSNYDNNGDYSIQGKTNEILLSSLLNDDFIQETPPKTCGREQFGKHYVDKLLNDHLPKNDNDWFNLFSTISDLTASSIYFNYLKFIKPKFEIEEIVISGGGAKNLQIMNKLKELFNHQLVVTSEKYGISIDEKEALAFAIMANDRIENICTNVPNVTGATKPVLLGKITEI